MNLRLTFLNWFSVVRSGIDARRRARAGMYPASRPGERPHMRLLVVTDDAIVTVDLDGHSLDDYHNLLQFNTDQAIWFLGRVMAARTLATIKSRAAKQRASARRVRPDLSAHARSAPRDGRGRFVPKRTGNESKQHHRTR